MGEREPGRLGFFRAAPGLVPLGVEIATLLAPIALHHRNERRLLSSERTGLRRCQVVAGSVPGFVAGMYQAFAAIGYQQAGILSHPLGDWRLRSSHDHAACHAY
ncbi:MAG: hypothetical protein EOM24_04650 [Chloroflexia bacterium]|nr:hypothetical protein [Chloroflexia bacterium]